jgi:hypothetical protein
MTTIRVGHLYPDYLNIYADRGNIAVFRHRTAVRGLELAVQAVSVGDELRAGEHDLLYIGGGQDREQELIAPDLAARGEAIREAVAGGAALLAVCGGYQLLGRFYRGRSGAELPGAGVFPLHTVAGGRRMIGDCLLECELEPGVRRTLVWERPSAPISTGRSCHGTRGWPIGSLLERSNTDSERLWSWIHSTTSSSTRRTTSQPREPDPAAAASNLAPPCTRACAWATADRREAPVREADV